MRQYLSQEEMEETLKDLGSRVDGEVHAKEVARIKRRSEEHTSELQSRI